MNNEIEINEISIELDFKFIEDSLHAINFHTRTACAIAQAEIIDYILKALFPEERFEILSLPPEEGSFKDLTVVKFLNDNSGAIQTVSILLAFLLFGSQIKLNHTTIDLNTLEIVEKCKEMGISEEKIKKIEDVCNSYYPKKQKNIFYDSIIADKSIVSIMPTITEDNLIYEKKINRNDFRSYLEEIPREKEYLKTDLAGNIQLSQPFIDKQRQYGRGVPWKGVYFGDDVFDENNEIIIQDGESVLFYMQDDEYKQQIVNQEISFTSGDNIGVVFDISRYYNYLTRQYGNPRLYIKKVTSHNDNLVQHKKELALKRESERYKEKYKNQGTLFEEIGGQGD